MRLNAKNESWPEIRALELDLGSAPRAESARQAAGAGVVSSVELSI